MSYHKPIKNATFLITMSLRNITWDLYYREQPFEVLARCSVETLSSELNDGLYQARINHEQMNFNDPLGVAYALTRETYTNSLINDLDNERQRLHDRENELDDLIKQISSQ